MAIKCKSRRPNWAIISTGLGKGALLSDKQGCLLRKNSTCINYFSPLLAPGQFWSQHLLTCTEPMNVRDGRTAPQTTGSLPPLALRFGREAGRDYGIQQVFHNSPIGSPWLGKCPGAGRSFRLIFQPHCGSFASFSRSSVGSVSSSTSDFELAQMHCADGAVTLTGLELIKTWNILDQ